LQRLERIVRSVIFVCLETKGKYWNVKFKSEEINLTMKKYYGGDFKSPDLKPQQDWRREL
jgi:hypothetical protein